MDSLERSLLRWRETSWGWSPSTDGQDWGGVAVGEGGGRWPRTQEMTFLHGTSSYSHAVTVTLMQVPSPSTYYASGAVLGIFQVLMRQCSQWLREHHLHLMVRKPRLRKVQSFLPRLATGHGVARLWPPLHVASRGGKGHAKGSCLWLLTRCPARSTVPFMLQTAQLMASSRPPGEPEGGGQEEAWA